MVLRCIEGQWKFFQPFSHVVEWTVKHTNFPIDNSSVGQTNNRNAHGHNNTVFIAYTKSNQLIWYFVIQWYATAAAKCSVDYFNLFVVVAVFDFCLALCTIDHSFSGSQVCVFVFFCVCLFGLALEIGFAFRDV